MKIALFSTTDNGGAGKATLRLHKGLNLIGEDSTLFLKQQTTSNEKIIQIEGPEVNNLLFESIVQEHFISNIFPGNTMSTLMYPSIGFDFLSWINDYDIINLHWISMFVSLEAIVKMNAMGKPLIWTLHDQNPMTGACHYTHGCDKYKLNCTKCPQLRHNPYDITKTIIETKIKYLPDELIIVTPSRWLAESAKESVVFKNHRIEVIPNSLEIDIFCPVNKEEAKQRLGIPTDAKVILFGAHTLKERRKGYLELVDIVQFMRLTTDREISQLLHEEKLYVITFGDEGDILRNIGIKYQALGYVVDDDQLALAYSAADVLALPSLEDNLPNIMLESLACGTPVVAFAVGGMVDVIENGKNGFLVLLNDSQKFAERLIDILKSNPMSEECRKYALEHFRLDLQAQAYRDLFQEVYQKNKSNRFNTNIPEIFPEISQVLMPYICDAAIAVQTKLNKTESDLNQQSKLDKYYEKWLEMVLSGNRSIEQSLNHLSIKSVTIFGTKKLAEILFEDLSVAGIKVECFLDNNQELHNKQFYNTNIRSLDWLKHNLEKIDAVVLSIQGNHDIEIKKQITLMTNNEKPVYSWKDLIDFSEV